MVGPKHSSHHFLLVLLQYLQYFHGVFRVFPLLKKHACVAAAGDSKKGRVSSKKERSFVVKKRIGVWVENEDGLLRAVT